MRDVPWEDIFNLSASGAGGEFCERVLVGSDVYPPHRKCQVKPHSSSWFSAACAAAVVHRRNVFGLYQHNKSFKYKIKSGRVAIVAKGFLKLPNFAYDIKTKESITSKKLGC